VEFRVQLLFHQRQVVGVQPQSGFAVERRFFVNQGAHQVKNLGGLFAQRVAGQLAAGGQGQVHQVLGDGVVQVGQGAAEFVHQIGQRRQGFLALAGGFVLAGAAAFFQPLGVAFLAAGLEAFPVAFPACFLTGFIAQRLQLGLMLKRLALFRVDRGRAGGARVAGTVQFPHPPAAPA
jgi:hypothetical protein